jgi:hypothetical protein
MDEPLPSPAAQAGCEDLLPLERRALKDAARLVVLEARLALVRRLEQGAEPASLASEVGAIVTAATDPLLACLAHVPPARSALAAVYVTVATLCQVLVSDLENLAHFRAAAAAAAATETSRKNGHAGGTPPSPEEPRP